MKPILLKLNYLIYVFLDVLIWVILGFIIGVIFSIDSAIDLLYSYSGSLNHD